MTGAQTHYHTWVPRFHQTMQCVVHPLCIVWWKPGCPCMAVCLCPSHLISVATPCLECVHASVHEFMSTLHPMSGPPPMDSYMESWVPLCVTSSVSHSSWFWPHTLFRMCTCISTWIYVHLAALGGGPHISSQVDINSCTDACTHSKEGVATKIRWLGHTCSDTQGHSTFHVTIHRGWTRHEV